jgi:hypothetical protein
MNEVKIQKEKLLAIVKQNRTEHRDIFIAAQDKYRDLVIQCLDEQLASARKKERVKLNMLVSITQPEDHTVEYDRAIRMLELTEDTVIVLDKKSFTNLVQDQWDWSHSWAASNMRYTSSPKFAGLSDD